MFINNDVPIASTFFEIDSDLRCGYITNPVLPVLNSTYKAKVERTDKINNSTVYYEEWNDFVNKRERYEYYLKDNNEVRLANKKEGSLYTIKGTDCYVTPYNTDVTNFTIRDILLNANKFNTKYQGK
jgi:hypothetical protein